MELLESLAGVFCAFATVLHVASILVIVARIRGAHRAGDLPPGRSPPVSIIRPVCGLENFGEETLGSTFLLNHRDVEVLFCVAHASDPVVPLVRRLIAANPHIPARLLVGNDVVSDNPKLNNIVKGWRAAAHEWVIIADSNVLMPPDYVQRLLATWRGDTGLVCSPPIGCRPDGIWAELECAFLNTYQGRWQLFADSIGIGFAQGKTMLWRKSMLENAGGIRALAAELAEDAAATKLVRRAGLRVRLVNDPYLQPLGLRTAADVWRRQLRWARLRRDSFRLFYAPEILSGAVPPLLAGAIAMSAWDWPMVASIAALATLWYGGEALLAHAAGWHLSIRSPVTWLLRDVMIPVLWAGSWLGNSFSWRGHDMRIADRSRSA